MENLTKKYITYKHSYHLVNPSPWPILTSFSALVLTSGMYFICIHIAMED